MAEEFKACGFSHIEVTLKKSERRVGELEVRYSDPKLDVYSFEYGDGIWGTSIDLLESDNLEKVIKKYGVEAIKDAEEGKEVRLCIPLGNITKDYSLITKKGDVVMLSDRDLRHISIYGEVNMPDGRRLEVDAEDSPLRKMGLI